YKNHACAKCHNDDGETVYWSLGISCGQYPDFPVSADPLDFFTLILREPNCEVVFTAPEGMEPRPCYVKSQDIIDRCNVTGERSQHDDALWKACSLFTTFARFKRQDYANSFCLRC
ncbi:hypothetical protein EGW08_015264, partial [Elysia chlorotica]